jgi:transglutaminase-like putative cysteine protease
VTGDDRASGVRRYRVTHRTTYSYGAEMTDGYSVATLVARATPNQRVLSSTVRAVPEPDEHEERRDQFGNPIVQFGVHQPHRDLVVESVSVVDLDPPLTPVDDTPWEAVVAALDSMVGVDALDVRPFRAVSPFTALAPDSAAATALDGLAQQAFAPGVGIVDGARALCAAIHQGFEFDPTFTEVSTPLADVLAARRGVCQDFAHLAIAAFRSLGLAARYVSGYIETEPPPGRPRLIGADASHAWCSVWTPRDGWVDLDPTNGHLPVERHVTVGWGRDYADVTPLRGVVIGPAAEQRLEVAVDMLPLGD